MQPLEKCGEQTLKKRDGVKAVAMPVRDQAGHEGSCLEKANGVQRKMGDVPRPCTMEITATGAQPPGRASCLQGHPTAEISRPSLQRG